MRTRFGVTPIRPNMATGETHGGRLGCLACIGKVTCFCHVFHVFPTILMCNEVWSDVIPLLQSSCLWYPFVALKNEAWDTWRPHIKAWCITWCFWSDSDNVIVRSYKLKRTCVTFFLLGRCWEIQTKIMVLAVLVWEEFTSYVSYVKHEHIHIQLAYDCPGFKLINSPMTGTIQSSEKIWQDIP